MYYVIALRHQVSDPQKAMRFFVDCLGFSISENNDYPFYVENGAISVILEQGDTQRLSLEVQCNDVDKEALCLLQNPEITCLQETKRHNNRVECRLKAPDGLSLILTKILNEDELDLLPPLPTTLVWDSGVDLQIRRILRMVPLGFRENARQRATAQAEFDAVEQGHLSVDEATAMTSIVSVTPAFQYPALMEAMQKEGIDSHLYMGLNQIEV